MPDSSDPVLKKFIETALGKQSLVTPKQREKCALIEDLDMTLTVLWTEKDTHPMAECTRVQISPAILFLCSTGARIGIIFPEGGKKHEKGLRYKVRLQGQLLQMLIVV